MGRRLTTALAVLSIIIALAAHGTAVADHCDNDSLGRPVTLNSGYTVQDGVLVAFPYNPYPFPTCSVAWAVPAELPESRRITPGATDVSVSYFGSTEPATLTAELNGLGFAARTVTLRKTAITGGFVWSSGWASIPDGPALSGSIQVKVFTPSGTRIERFFVLT